MGVHRNTVLSAIGELVSQGWVVTEPARGTFVSAELPVAWRRAAEASRAAPASPAFSLYRRGSPSRTSVAPPVPLMLGGGTPDPRLFPNELLARAVRKTLRRHGERVLDYGDVRGQPRLRAALAALLSERRGLAIGADDVFVTRGSQMALWLVAQVLLRSGDRVAVESYGYRPAWDALRAAGADLRAVPVDESGIDVGAVERLAQQGGLRAVYVTPHHQFPTLAVLSAERRLRLLALAREHRFAIIEDDYDNEYHFDGQPVLPLASHDQHGSVVYVGTLSKVLAPGLRIGYVVAPAALSTQLADLRLIVDRQGDATIEHAIAELIEDGEVQRHIRKTKRLYQARRAELVSRLRDDFAGAVELRVPPGGMALWVRVDDAYDVDRWVTRSLERGVFFSAGRDHHFARRDAHHARIGFARVDEREIRRATAILRETLEECRR